MPITNEPTTDGHNIETFSAHARKIVQAARLHANNLLRSADELEKLINPVIDSVRLLSRDHTNAKYNEGFEIRESQLKANLKQLTENVDKCTEVVDSVSQLQKLNLSEIATCISTAQEKQAMSQGKSQKVFNLISRLNNTTKIN